MLYTSPKWDMAIEGPTKAEINAVFKRLKSIPANKVQNQVILTNCNKKNSF